jgi:hypothetical protein
MQTKHIKQILTSLMFSPGLKQALRGRLTAWAQSRACHFPNPTMVWLAVRKDRGTSLAGINNLGHDLMDQARKSSIVIPAQAGIQWRKACRCCISGFRVKPGMT